MTARTSGSHTPQAAPHATAQTPWSVKGIAPQTREAVKEAARRSGMTIGEWLNCAITRQARAEPLSPRTPSADERWAEIATHLARLVHRNAEALPPAARTPSTPAPAASMHAIERWLREAEARAVRRERIRAARLAEALTALARYVDNAESARVEEARRVAQEHAQATQELSHAMARIMRQLKRIDERITHAQQSGGQRSEEADDAQARQVAAQARQVATHLAPVLEQRLATGLREIVESVSAAVRTPPPTPATVAPQAAAPDIEQLKVEDRLARAIVDIRARQVELARLEQRDDGSQQAMLERLEALSRKLDDVLQPAAGDAPRAALDAVLDRLDHISARLEESRQPLALSRVEDMVRSLSENVETLHRDGAQASASASEAALQSLATQISQLARRLEDLPRQGADPGSPGDAESRSRLQSLETAVGVLSLQLRDLPHADEATLERMARAAAREALGALSPEDALPRARSEDTLDAVHNTLERIVDRLALIEEDIRASGVGLQSQQANTAAPGDEATGGAHPREAEPHGALSEPEIRAARALSRVFTEAAPETPASALGEPEDLLARSNAGLTENVGFTASFIAAARRAAMAAVDETRHNPTSPASDEATDSTGRRRSLLIGLGALIAATGAAQVAASLMHGAARLS